MAIILKALLLYLSCFMTVLEAMDLGIQGHFYKIEEEDLLELLQKKTRTLSVEETIAVKKKLQNNFKGYLCAPDHIQGLEESQVYRVVYLDPSISADQDIKNHLGEIIVRKGACINPLENIPYLDSLLFFDADNPQHLEWARSQKELVKWVLTKGKPLDLEEQEKRPVYFDQFGVLVKKFGLKHLPAKVSREGLKLKIEEIPLGGSLCVK